MFLRKKFIPEADHLHIINNKVFFGENVIGFGGFVKVIKSAFLPMGYLSSSYSDDIQRMFSLFWIISIFIGLILILKFLKFNLNKLKKVFILFFLILISAVPHLTPRSKYICIGLMLFHF